MDRSCGIEWLLLRLCGTLEACPGIASRKPPSCSASATTRVRRWIDAGRLRAGGADGRTTVDGADLAALAESLADHPDREATRAARSAPATGSAASSPGSSRTAVMAQVELICGPYRLVSLMSAEAADELGLEPGVRAIASVKSTNVVDRTPLRGSRVEAQDPLPARRARRAACWPGARPTTPPTAR